MQEIITLFFKSLRFVYTKIRIRINKFITWWSFYSNNIHFKNFTTNGIPFVVVGRHGTCFFGNHLKINNNLSGNPIGRTQRCIFFVDNGAVLKIGDNARMSSTAIVAHKSITIGKNVTIGGGVCVYDTDFHSINPIYRLVPEKDKQNEIKLPVTINDNVFIGAHSTILKGVTIGENSVIGACSVVTKNIPPNEIWAGNPAKFIKKIPALPLLG